MLSGKLRQAIRRANDREGGGCLLPDKQCTKTGQQVAEVLREKHPDMCVLTVGNLTCTVFEDYRDVPKTVLLDFTEDDVTWVASKLSSATGALGAESIELRNCLLRFGCSSEELKVFIARLADWMANSSPLWAGYYVIMAWRLVALDKRSDVHPVGIGETLLRSLAKIVIRAAGD